MQRVRQPWPACEEAHFCRLLFGPSLVAALDTFTFEGLAIARFTVGSESERSQLWHSKALRLDMARFTAVSLPMFSSPSKVEFPVKSSPGHVAGGDVLEALVGDDIDDRAHYCFAIGR